MKTVTINIFTFDELSEKAKETAIENYNRAYPFDSQHIYDEARETVKAFCEETGIKTGNRSWLDPYTMHIDDNIVGLKGLRLRTWVINNWWWWLYKPKYRKHSKDSPTESRAFGHRMIRYSQLRDGKLSKKYVSGAFVVCECPLTGVCYDMSLLMPILDLIERYDAKSHDHETFDSLINQCFSELAKDIESEVEANETEEELIEDRIECNDVTFLEDGTIYKH